MIIGYINSLSYFVKNKRNKKAARATYLITNRYILNFFKGLTLSSFKLRAES